MAGKTGCEPGGDEPPVDFDGRLLVFVSFNFLPSIQGSDAGAQVLPGQPVDDEYHRHSLPLRLDITRCRCSLMELLGGVSLIAILYRYFLVQRQGDPRLSRP